MQLNTFIYQATSHGLCRFVKNRHNQLGECFLRLHSLSTDTTRTLQQMEFHLDTFSFIMRRRDDIK